jgi:hypothetical protein
MPWDMFYIRNKSLQSNLKKKSISHKETRFRTELKGKKYSQIAQGIEVEVRKVVSDQGYTWDIFPRPQSHCLPHYAFTTVFQFPYLCFYSFLS